VEAFVVFCVDISYINDISYIMSFKNMDIWGSANMNEMNQPLYLKIYDMLLDGIKNGKYDGGSRLPSEKELAEEFSVSRITSKKALEMLANDGYILRMPGKGSFVIENNDNKISEQNNKGKKEACKKIIVGVIIPDFSSSYGMRLFLSIQKEAYENDCFIIPYFSYSRQELEEKAIDELTQLGVDGIIIMPAHGENYNPKLVRLVLDGFPVVVIDRYLKGIPAAFVGSDNVNAAKKATDYLIDLGHKNISFVSPPMTNTSTIEDRKDGFIRSHAEKGVAIDESLWITNLVSTIPRTRDKANLQKDVENIKNLIIKNPQITCFFVIEYNLALLVLKAVKSLGKRIPDDISILCFDSPSDVLEDCFFTHIQQNEEKMGVQAFQLFLKQLNDSTVSDKVILGTDLIIGKSTKSILD
ncbi:MAG TPA: GntR family transcriptional regulator, partial [Clostridiaceae bacterium]|nr:GntR family transcriptional regulator [Clostridiaceae bacterium]